MNIGVIGSGMVGRMLAAGLLKHGHRAMLGTRDTAKPDVQKWLQENPSGSAGTFEQTAQFGELIVLATRGPVREKVLSNMAEAKARESRVIAVSNPNDHEVVEIADEILEVPATHHLIQPIINVVPLQLLAYHIADRKGCDVDQPRNLAKTVTVE